MLVLKEIGPKKLKQDAFRRQFRNACKRAGYGIQRDFEKTTATWEHKPKFTSSTSVVGPGPAVLVETDDEIYTYVDKGTKPHEIWAGAYTGKSDKKVLAFQGTYTAKTVPGVIGSRSGGKSGEWVHTPMVQHPGTKARNFDAIIERKWTPRFKAEIEQAMRDAVAECGHGL